jgi:apolipoprotein N-acyltransferase
VSFAKLINYNICNRLKGPLSNNLPFPYSICRYFQPHLFLCTFRAIENGFSLVREASYSRAMAVDYEGNVLAASDYFTTDPQVKVTYVSTQGVRTIYAVIGHVFAWLSVLGLVLLIGVAFLRRPQR